MENLPAIQEPTQDLVPMPVMSVQQAVARLKEFQAFVQGAMVKGTDYGIIPGTPKPTLLKPGAEKLAEMYGLAPIPTTTHRVEDWEHGFFHYEVRVDLVSKRTGQVMAGGIGSCNSKESRYARRWVFPNDVPEGIDRKTLQKRERTGRNGKPYTQYCIENDDIYTQVNTIHKMAKKRALIDATLSATRSSGMFTQDVEDWVDGDVTEVPEQASVYDASPKAARPSPAAQNDDGMANLRAELTEMAIKLAEAGLTFKPLDPSKKRNMASFTRDELAGHLTYLESIWAQAQHVPAEEAAG